MLPGRGEGVLEIKLHSKIIYTLFTVQICPIFPTLKKKKELKNCIHWALVVLSNWFALKLPQVIGVKNTCGNKTRDLTGLSGHPLWAWEVEVVPLISTRNRKGTTL